MGWATYQLVQDFFQQYHWHLMDDVEVRFESTAVSLLPMGFDSTTQARLYNEEGGTLAFPSQVNQETSR